MDGGGGDLTLHQLPTLIKEWMATEEELRTLSAEMREKRKRAKTVREMLMRPRIAGISEHLGKEVGPAKWPPLVDETSWRTVVSILSNPGLLQRKFCKTFLVATDSKVIS